MATRRNLHVAEGRFVLTYEVDGVPVGVLTGEKSASLDGTLSDYRAHLEHMILFPGYEAMYLPQMLAAALQYAAERKFKMVTFTIRETQPKAKALQRLAARHGFEQLSPSHLWRLML
jgi:hypothetical protein